VREKRFFVEEWRTKERDVFFCPLIICRSNLIAAFLIYKSNINHIYFHYRQLQQIVAQILRGHTFSISRANAKEAKAE
jgi:hypothetical protein